MYIYLKIEAYWLKIKLKAAFYLHHKSPNRLKDLPSSALEAMTIGFHCQ
jgi:hypothetical protein